MGDTGRTLRFLIVLATIGVAQALDWRCNYPPARLHGSEMKADLWSVLSVLDTVRAGRHPDVRAVATIVDAVARGTRAR